jgi:uncharacterized protein (DUF885 family)
MHFGQTMKRVFKWIAIALLSLVLLAAALVAHTWYAKPLSVDWFYAKVFVKFMLDNPELLTRLRLFEQAGIRGHNAKLSDSSPPETERTMARMQEHYETLKRYDATSYTGQDALSYRIMERFLGTLVEGAPWRYHYFAVNQLFGVQSELPNLMTQIQQINDATDAEHYLARLALYPQKMDGVIEGMQLREKMNIVPPKFVVEKVATQLADFLAPGAKGNALTVAFKQKLDKILADKLDQAARDALLRRAEEAVAAHVIPAYRKLAAANEALRAKATANHGAWALPDGERYYQYCIRLHTTTDMQAAALHELGLREVARIGAEMDAILEAAGYGQGTRAGVEGLPGHHRRNRRRSWAVVPFAAEGEGGGRARAGLV